MPTSSKPILVAVAVVVVLAGAILCMFGAGDGRQSTDRVTSLEQWEELTRRPGFALLDKADLPDYFVCVYETNAAEVAFCYRWKHTEDGPDTCSFIVRDSNGQDLQDTNRSNATTELNAVGSIPEHLYVHGMVVPIPRDHRGQIRVEFMDNEDAEFPTRSVYAKTLHLGAGDDDGGPGQSR